MSDPANIPRLIVDKANPAVPAEPERQDESGEISGRQVETEPQHSGPVADAGWASISARAVLQVVLAAAVLYGALAGMNRLIATKPEGATRPTREQVYTVKTVQVQPADHQPVFTVYGNTVAGDTVDLRALVSGEIVAVHPDLRAGHTVRAGEVLVEIDEFEYQGALTEARANLQEAEAQLAEIKAKIGYEQAALERTRNQLALAERDLQRSQDLQTRGSGTQKSTDDRQMTVFERAQSLEQRQSNLAIEKARADQQDATIRRLQWKVAQAERDLENTRLQAPFDGVISMAAAGLGRNISANDVIVSLYRSDRLEVRFVVTDAQYGRLLSSPQGVVGRPVEVIWDVGGEAARYAARVERVGAELKSDRGGVELYAAIDLTSSETNIRPGAFVEVAVPDKVYGGTVRLPETAVYNGNRVYVVNQDRLVARSVDVATFTGGDVIIAGGLEAGDRVLITQIADARDGLKVNEEGAAPKRPKRGEDTDAQVRARTPPEKDTSGKSGEEGTADAKPADRT